MTIILQHTDQTTPGSVTDILNEGGHAHELRHLHRGAPVPMSGEADAIILLGGSINVDQDEAVPFLRAEKAFLKSELARGTPVLGLCLGAQLIADALGAKVGPHPVGWEVGWRDVACLAEPHVTGFATPAVRRVSHYHRYVFDLPPGARLLAQNDWWLCQAFAHGPRVIGLQFHPERTCAQNRELALADDLPPPAAAVQSRDEILGQAAAAANMVRPWFAEIVNGWLTHARGP